jgi:hypothetical protein
MATSTSTPIGFGEVGNEMSQTFRPKTEEEKRNSPLNLIGAYLLGNIKDSISPSGSVSPSGVNLNNDAYFNANPISTYSQQSPVAPPTPIMNSNEGINPIHSGPIHSGPIHSGPTHFGPRPPDPAHLQIDSDWK